MGFNYFFILSPLKSFNFVNNIKNNLYIYKIMKNFIELLFHEVFKILINSKNEIQNSKNSIKNQMKNFTF